MSPEKYYALGSGINFAALLFGIFIGRRSKKK